MMGATRDALHLAHGEITHKIIGAFYEVFNEPGHGFVESVYAKALPIALSRRGLRFEREALLPVRYQGTLVGEFRPDLIIERKVIVELKATERITSVYEGQLLNYLRAGGLVVGLILNFGARAGTRRLIWTGAPVERG